MPSKPPRILFAAVAFLYPWDATPAAALSWLRGSIHDDDRRVHASRTDDAMAAARRNNRRARPSDNGNGDKSENDNGDAADKNGDANNNDDNDSNGEAEDNGSDDRVDTSDIFGFVDGTDISEAGTKSLSFDLFGRVARSPGDFLGLRGSADFTYSATNHLSYSLIGLFDHTQTSLEPDVDALGDPVRNGFADNGFGLVTSAKYRLRQRTDNRPGLAVELSPFWQRSSDVDRDSSDILGAEFRLLADAALIPETVFAAVNLAYAPTFIRAGADDSWTDAPTLDAGGAVSVKASKNAFLGAELRYRSLYSGHPLDELAGWALFAGPTVYMGLGEAGYIGAAWSIQFAGKAADEPERDLDLVNFARHEFRLKSGFVF